MARIRETNLSATQIHAWLSKATALLTYAVELQQTVNGWLIKRALAEKLGNKKAVTKYEIEVAHVQREFNMAISTLYEATGQIDMEGVSMMMTDVRAGLGNAYEVYEAYRKAAALVEVLRHTNGFDGPEGEATEMQGAEKISQLQREYDVQLELISRKIPRGTVIDSL